MHFIYKVLFVLLAVLFTVNKLGITLNNISYLYPYISLLLFVMMQFWIINREKNDKKIHIGASALICFASGYVLGDFLFYVLAMVCQ